MKVDKTLYFEENKIKEWEKFCIENFNSKRVLSKVITEAMEEYIINYN